MIQRLFREVTLEELLSFEDCSLTCNSEDDVWQYYFFIDEISYMSIHTEDNSLNILSDVYCTLGIRIVVAGTFSYFIKLLSKEVLFDRVQMIDTTYFSFKEAHEVLGYSIEEFIKYGGIIRGVGENFTPYEYMDTAVTNNIVKSLVKSDRLYELAANDPEFESIISLDAKRRDAKIATLIRQTIDRFMSSLIYEYVVKENYRYSYIGNLTDVIRQRSNREHITEGQGHY